MELQDKGMPGHKLLGAVLYQGIWKLTLDIKTNLESDIILEECTEGSSKWWTINFMAKMEHVWTYIDILNRNHKWLSELIIIEKI